MAMLWQTCLHVGAVHQPSPPQSFCPKRVDGNGEVEQPNASFEDVSLVKSSIENVVENVVSFREEASRRRSPSRRD